MKKPYDDKQTFTVSECAFCSKYSEGVKCSVYPEGIPQEVLSQSFPGYPRYNKEYCKERAAVGKQDSKRK